MNNLYETRMTHGHLVLLVQLPFVPTVTKVEDLSFILVVVKQIRQAVMKQHALEILPSSTVRPDVSLHTLLLDSSTSTSTRPMDLDGACLGVGAARWYEQI